MSKVEVEEVQPAPPAADLSAGPYPVRQHAAAMVPAVPIGYGQQDLEGEGLLVAAFLTYIGLGQCVNSLIANGFDSIESLHLAQDHDLLLAGVPPSRVNAFKLGLERLAGGGGMTPTTARLPSEDHRLAVATRISGVPGGKWSEPTEKARTIVQTSWDSVKAIGLQQVSVLLIAKLFKIAPSSKALFPVDVRFKYRDWSPEEGDMGEEDIMQSPGLVKLFMRVLNAVGGAVAGLHDIGQLVPQLNSLGRRHIDYGTQEDHFLIMQECLVLVLRDGLGASFTKEVEHSWRMVYTFVAAVILEGLAQAEKDVKKTGCSGQWSSLHSSTRASSEQDIEKASLRSSSHSMASLSPTHSS